MSIFSYKKQTPSTQYDSIVIGSGPGGLATAALLAKEGQKVLVLERHYTAGGYTHVFKRRGYEWDVGIHYLGEVNRPGGLLDALLHYITDEPIEWADMGEVYDRIRIDEEEFHFVKGRKNFAKNLKKAFPEEASAIDEYLKLIKEVSAASRNFFMEKALPPTYSFFVGGMLRKKFLKYADKTTLEVLSSLTQNKKLIAVLSGQYGDYGLPPSQSSFAMHAVLVKHYLYGGCYPVGGASVIAPKIANVIAAKGGAVYTNAEVKEVVLEGKKAIGVRMADDKIIKAKNIISGTGYVNTYTKLFSAEKIEKFQLEKQLPVCGPSASHMSLYIGFEQTAEELNLPKANYWLYKGVDHDKAVKEFLDDPKHAEFPVVYVSYPSAKDPDFLNRYPGKATMEIVTLAPYDIFAEWADGRWKKRGADYEALKEQFAQRLLQRLYEVHPELEGKIAYYELSTPLSTQHFCNYATGEIYGLSHSPERFRLKQLKPTTPIRNFYMTGQDIVSCGFGGALMGGVLTVSRMYGAKVANKLRKLAIARAKARN
jgi:all-trans-retinol 13,14-reductase